MCLVQFGHLGQMRRSQCDPHLSARCSILARWPGTVWCRCGRAWHLNLCDSLSLWLCLCMLSDINVPDINFSWKTGPVSDQHSWDCDHQNIFRNYSGSRAKVKQFWFWNGLDCGCKEIAHLAWIFFLCILASFPLVLSSVFLLGNEYLCC